MPPEQQVIHHKANVLYADQKRSIFEPFVTPHRILLVRKKMKR